MLMRHSLHSTEIDVELIPAMQLPLLCFTPGLITRESFHINIVNINTHEHLDAET